MATVTKPMALDETLQTTNGLLTSTNSNSLADVMEDGIANIVSAIGAIPTPTAANVSFDDSQAGLGESNVQGAIDALNNNLADSTVSTQIVTANSSVSVPAGSAASTSDFTVPTGYTYLGTVGWFLGNESVYVFNNGIYSDGATIYPRLALHNISGSAVTITPKIVMLLKPS